MQDAHRYFSYFLSSPVITLLNTASTPLGFFDSSCLLMFETRAVKSA